MFSLSIHLILASKLTMNLSRQAACAIFLNLIIIFFIILSNFANELIFFP
jgi:hypothetical protein